MTNAPTFKIATIKDNTDGAPKVSSTTLQELVQRWIKKPRSVPLQYDGYHAAKAAEKLLTVESREAHNAGDMERAQALRALAKERKKVQDGAKNGPALMPYHYKDDLTFKEDVNGKKQRDNHRITHWSMLQLDIESNTSVDEIHAVLAQFEYVLWPTISHKPEDPRYRVLLPLATPLKPSAAVELMLRIDAHLPDRNDITKKTQAIDPAGLDEKGRLMYWPTWLSKHPEKYFYRYNAGAVLQATDFELSDAQKAAQEQRQLTGAATKTERVKTYQSKVFTKSSDHPTVIQRNGKFFLNPEGYLETAEGYVLVKDITDKVSDVSCPVHGDSNGSEFASKSNGTLDNPGNVFLHCKHCGTIWADKPQDDGKLVFKKAAPKATTEPKQTVVPAVLPPFAKKTDPLSSFVFNKHETITHYNDRYLDPTARFLIAEKGITMIKSPKGTGKTTILRPFIDECRKRGESVMVMGHRVNLLRELASPEKLNLDFYLDIENNGKSDFMAICMDSLTRYDLDNDQAPHTIIIDESEQVFRHLLSQTLRENRTKVFNTLIWMLQNGTRIITLDADITSDMTLELVRMFRGEAKCNSEAHSGIINNYVFTGRETQMYDDQYQLLQEAVESAVAGRKVFISTNKRENGAEVFARIFEATKKRVLLVSALTSEEDPAVKEFMTNTSEESKNYDVIICTPTAQTGISIDNDHFDEVYGFFWDSVGTYQDIDQGMSRVRRVNTHKVWIQKVNHKTPLATEEQIFNDVVDVEKNGARKIIHGLETAPKLTQGELKYAYIYARIQSLENLWKRDKYVKFMELRAATGYSLKIIPRVKVASEQGKEMFDEAKSMPTENEVMEIWRAAELTPEEHMRLKAKKGKRTREEYLQVKRYDYKENLAEWTLTTLTEAVGMDLLKVVAKLEKYTLWTLDQQIGYDRKSAEIHRDTIPDRSQLLMTSGLINTLCDAAGYPLLQLIKDARAALDDPAAQIEITQPQLMAMAQAFEENKKDFSRYMGCRIQDATDEKNLKKVWNAVLGPLLPLTSEKSTTIDKVTRKRGRRYFVNHTGVDHILVKLDKLMTELADKR